MNRSLTKEHIRRLLEVHRECGVPLQHAVALIFRVKRLSLNSVAVDAGYQRTSLYKALAGEIVPPVPLRTTIRLCIGVDPWEVYGIGAGACARATVQLKPIQ